MDIMITKTSKDAIHEFDDAQWAKADKVHYGDKVWESEKYYFKAEQDGEIVGTVSGDYESGTVYVKKLIVKEELRSQGIGEKLRKQVEEYAKEKHAHKVWLQTGKEWRANNFYKRLGYEVTATHPNHYFGQDFVIYTKFL